MDKPRVLVVDEEPDIVEAVKFNPELEEIAERSLYQEFGIKTRKSRHCRSLVSQTMI